MTASNDPVVAALPEKSQNPFSSIALSPSKRYAVIAEKDTLRLVKLDPSGIENLRNFKASQYFQASLSKDRTKDYHGGGSLDVFKLGVKQPSRSGRSMMAYGNVIINEVAWSPPQTKEQSPSSTGSYQEAKSADEDMDSQEDSAGGTLVAAGGSNGVIAIWNAKQTFFSGGSKASSTVANQQPEAILSQEHTQAVNSLAWHPKRPGILLSASQDSTVKLWERREVEMRRSKTDGPKNILDFFNMMQHNNEKEYSWFCKATFEPKSEAIREVQWSQQHEDVFAVVTTSGSLVIYNMHITWKAIIKIAAHAGDATCLDWHPTLPYTVATGGAGDRCVKVWDVERSLNMNADENIMAGNANTWNTVKSEVSANSNGSTETEKSTTSLNGMVIQNTASAGSSGRGFLSPSGQSGRKSQSKMTKHVITIGSSVTKIRWRPSSLRSKKGKSLVTESDKNDTMLAVATAQLTSAGGSGVISLRSTSRPFMALSVVEGHQGGGVADFVWVQTPEAREESEEAVDAMSESHHDAKKSQAEKRKTREESDSKTEELAAVRSGGRGGVEGQVFDSPTFKDTLSDDRSIWQHVLSVGRDGKCLLQSFVRGDRPISHVPSSCLAMAPMSPFQLGYGSLQVFAVHQDVPNAEEQDFELTGLRQDTVTSKAPGVFNEAALVPRQLSVPSIPGDRRIPEKDPKIIFNTLDDGPLNDFGLPNPSSEDNRIQIAPELVHLSRCSSLYKLHPDGTHKTRVELCRYNGAVAASLQCAPLARTWYSVAEILSGSGLDELPATQGQFSPMNAMHFIILPTLKDLLLERAEAGDVQTCVSLCEVLQVIEPEQTRIPGLDLNLVREWYLTYIDLLHQMCLFSDAAFVIKSCKDPIIGALNQQSTTIHESCPRCGKAQPPSSETGSIPSARRICQNCRRRIGLCFLCHEPVKGLYTWCSGCGHGGHVECAIQWFGSISGEKKREVCPTGCGHRCNLVQTVTAFPRMNSMQCVPVSTMAVKQSMGSRVLS